MGDNPNGFRNCWLMTFPPWSQHTIFFGITILKKNLTLIGSHHFLSSVAPKIASSASCSHYFWPPWVQIQHVRGGVGYSVHPTEVLSGESGWKILGNFFIKIQSAIFKTSEPPDRYPKKSWVPWDPGRWVLWPWECQTTTNSPHEGILQQNHSGVATLMI